MGRLVTGEISTFFNGVSRQPDIVRLPSQVEESDNTVLSVVSGGFSKRMPSEHLDVLTDLSSGTAYKVKSIYVSSTEQYIAVFANGSYEIYDALTGTKETQSGNAFGTYLNTDPSNLQAVTIGDTTFVVNTTVVTAFDTGTVAHSLNGTKQTFADLPATPATNDVWRIRGDDSSGFSQYYVRWTGTDWEEWAKPGQYNQLNGATMPHILVKSGGNWSLQEATWDDRTVGDRTTVPDPIFLGKTISDVFFFKKRLGLLAGENTYYSRAGETFNFWPTSSVIVLDTDPFGHQAPSDNTAKLNFAVPFRKVLFTTSDSDQFEVSTSDLFTPSEASIDQATSYDASGDARPAKLGNELYFAGVLNNKSVLFEYFFDEQSVGTTAVDVSKHVGGYIPANIKDITSASNAGRIFMRTTDDPDALYVYSVYWDGTEKIQSAWNRWVFEGDSVLGIGVLGDYLYMVIDRATEICLERVPVDILESPVPLIDRKTDVTGSYNAGTGLTTWTLPYNHNDEVTGVLSSSFTGEFGRVLNLTHVQGGGNEKTVTAIGDFSANAVHFGLTYQMTVTLSKLYLRTSQEVPQLRGKLVLRDLEVEFKDSGYFEVAVTAKGRTEKVKKMTGRIIGDANNVIGELNNISGSFRAPVHTAARTADIHIRNPSIWPCTIANASWKGFFNETTLAQDAGASTTRSR